VTVQRTKRTAVDDTKYDMKELLWGHFFDRIQAMYSEKLEYSDQKHHQVTREHAELQRHAPIVISAENLLALKALRVVDERHYAQQAELTRQRR